MKKAPLLIFLSLSIFTSGNTLAQSNIVKTNIKEIENFFANDIFVKNTEKTVEARGPMNKIPQKSTECINSLKNKSETALRPYEILEIIYNNNISIPAKYELEKTEVYKKRLKTFFYELLYQKNINMNENIVMKVNISPEDVKYDADKEFLFFKKPLIDYTALSLDISFHISSREVEMFDGSYLAKNIFGNSFVVEKMKKKSEYLVFEKYRNGINIALKNPIYNHFQKKLNMSLDEYKKIHNSLVLLYSAKIVDPFFTRETKLSKPEIDYLYEINHEILNIHSTINCIGIYSFSTGKFISTYTK